MYVYIFLKLFTAYNFTFSECDSLYFSQKLIVNSYLYRNNQTIYKYNPSIDWSKQTGAALREN